MTRPARPSSAGDAPSPPSRLVRLYRRVERIPPLPATALGVVVTSIVLLPSILAGYSSSTLLLLAAILGLAAAWMSFRAAPVLPDPKIRKNLSATDPPESDEVSKTDAGPLSIKTDEPIEVAEITPNAEELIPLQLPSVVPFPPHILAFVDIRGGTFLMGDRDDGPTHKVTLSPFRESRTVVTRECWRDIMSSRPKGASWSMEPRGDDRMPANEVTWFEAVQFCNEFSRRCGYTPAYSPVFDDQGRPTQSEITINPNADGFRLPTEAQWEYACRAGTTTRYWSGDADADLARVGWYAENSGRTVHPVAELPANSWGLYDMHGNVWEWCHDWHGQYPIDPTTDPLGPPSGSGVRVVRGGSAGSDAWGARSANRGRFDPSNAWAFLGFRVVLPSLRHR